ncbi:MAG: glycosyltransferase family 2 protein [Paracoccus sp. (in: a-proteobacteria)]
MPSLSLIIPAYNAGAYLDLTLASVHKQSFSDFECFVIDDFSDDNTLDIAKQWRARDRRIQIITQRARSGVSGARNAGLRAARGTLCAFLDADDLLMHDSLALRLKAWQKAVLSEPETADRIAGSYCGSQAIPETLKQPPLSRPTGLPPVGFTTVGGRCPFNANQPMIRRDVLRELGGFNETMTQAEDYDLWSRILRAGYWFVPASHVAVTYRTRQGSAVRKTPLSHLETSLALQDSGIKPLDQTTLSRSPRRMVHPHIVYQNQIVKANRVLQFSGMALFSPEKVPETQIATVAASHLPDMPHVLAPGSSAQRLIADGVQRQTGASPSAEMGTRIDGLLTQINQLRTKYQVPEPAESEFGPFGTEAGDRLWHPDRQAEIDILFLPHKDYHVWTINLAAPAMHASGLRFAVADLSAQWRDGGVRNRAAKADLPLIPFGEIALGSFAPRLLVCFNDWDFVTRPILVAAQEAGIATAAIVEGIQDYHDADTGRKRHAYQLADTILLPGDFDRRYFPAGGRQKLEVSGIPRVQHLRIQSAKRPASAVIEQQNSRRVLINSNFSHNVLTEKRDDWLRTVVAAVQNAGLEPVISRHPEDRGTLFPEYVTKDGFYDVLETCCASVQRFASGILEALACNVPVIYFNPHGEQVDKFSSDPMGAYPIALTSASLQERLSELPVWRDAAMARADAFLDHHTGAMHPDSSELISAALKVAMGPKPSPEMQQRFYRNLSFLDRETQALTRRVNIFEDPNTAIEDLRKMVEVEQNKASLVQVADSIKITTTTNPANKTTTASIRTGLVWRGRIVLHGVLKSIFDASVRWPRLHKYARRAGEYYMRHFSPL